MEHAQSGGAEMANPEPAYYFTQDGHECGPVSTAQIKKLAATDRLKSSDKVRRSGTGDWVDAESLVGLSQRRASMPPVPPHAKEAYDIEDELLGEP
jgi:GYF domain 2